MALRKHNGFSLLELVIAISISLILAGVTYIGLQPLLLQGHVNTGYEKTLMLLRNTRNQAITQGHQYQITFTAATVQVQYQPPAPAVGAALPPIQQVMTYTLPPDVSFATNGYPANAPDGFGTGANALDFESSAQPGVPLAPPYLVFMPDGSAQDNLGNLLSSGVVYITLPAGSKYDSKAITVWGATGRVRGWALTQVAGVPTWVQE
jgi:prepilin-type N-terminal cleavage/methylation domain-containing protein